MKLGPVCKDCCICGCANICLAGNGDDDFVLASKEEIIARLDEGRFFDNMDQMISCLKNHYGYNYSGVPGSKERREPKYRTEDITRIMHLVLIEGVSRGELISKYGFSETLINEVSDALSFEQRR